MLDVSPFGLSNVVCLVGIVGRSDKATQERENVQSNTSRATSVAEMSAVLTTDNSSKLM